MAGGASVTGAPATPHTAGHDPADGHADTHDPAAGQADRHEPRALRAAILAAAGWAAGALLLALVSILVEARGSDWRGPVAPASLVYAAAFATASYGLRFLRWHLLATRLAPGLPAGESFITSAIGFALILTPGRAGELLKLLLLRQRTSVPVASSTPIFLLEKLCEAAALAGLAVGASLFLPWGHEAAPAARLWLVGAALAALAAAIALRAHLVALVPRLPLAGRLLRRPRPAALWSQLVAGVSQVLTWRMLLAALGLSLAARLCDGVAIVWVASLYGIDLSLAAGWFAIGSSGFLGGVSMLPGGVGVAEAALVGLFVAFGAGPSAALATALTSRLLIFWVWVVLGLGLALRYVAHPWAERPGEAP